MGTAFGLPEEESTSSSSLISEAPVGCAVLGGEGKWGEGTVGDSCSPVQLKGGVSAERAVGDQHPWRSMCGTWSWVPPCVSSGCLSSSPYPTSQVGNLDSERMGSAWAMRRVVRGLSYLADATRHPFGQPLVLHCVPHPGLVMACFPHDISHLPVTQ